MRHQVIERITKARVIAILRGIHGLAALQAARALAAGGIELVEVTFDSGLEPERDPAAETVRLLREELDGQVLVGAGTVLCQKQTDLAAQAGASFILSPDVCPSVIARTRELGMVSIPGAATPTEILTASRCGADFVKLFPAAALGEPYLRALQGPMRPVGLIAVGGINNGNVARFLAAGAVAVGVGGGLITGQDAGEIQAKAEELLLAAKSTAGSD